MITLKYPEHLKNQVGNTRNNQRRAFNFMSKTMHDLFYSNKYTHTQTHIEIVNNLKNKKDNKKKKCLLVKNKQTKKQHTSCQILENK